MPKEHENYTRLETNARQTTDNVSSYLKSPQSDSDFEDMASAAFTSAMRSAYRLAEYQTDGTVDYFQIIEALEERRDTNQHISRRFGGKVHDDETRDLIRDASKAIAPIDPNPESLVIVHVNWAQGAELLLDLALEGGANPIEIAAKRIQIRLMVKNAVSSLSGLTDPKTMIEEIKRRNEDLLDVLRTVRDASGKQVLGKDKDLLKNLQYAKEMAQLDFPHHHITTISSIQGRKLVESDVMALGLSDSFKEDFVKIKNAGMEAIGVDWFDKLNNTQKAMLVKYADKFIEGNHVIPIQLVKLVPCMRNAYRKVSYVTKVNQPTQLDPTPISVTHHPSAIAHLGKGDHLSNTKETLEQASSFFPRAQKLLLNMLTSGVGWLPSFLPEAMRADTDIVNIIVRAANQLKDKIGVATTPVNVKRQPLEKKSRTLLAKIKRFVGIILCKDNGKEAYAAVFKELAKIANHAKLDAIKEYLESDKGDAQKAYDQLKIAPSKIKDDLRMAIEAKYLLAGGKSLRRESGDEFKLIQSDNDGLEILARMKIIGGSFSEGHLGEYAQANRLDVDIDAITTYCKSGKDRTGLVELYTTHLALCNRLGIQPDSDEARANLATAINSSHAQYMASVQGGSRGAYGLLTNIMGYVNKKIFAGLGLETAKLNKVETMGAVTKIMKSLKDKFSASNTVAKHNSAKGRAGLL